MTAPRGRLARAARMLAARGSPVPDVRVRIGIALLVCICALATFVALATAVAHHGALTRYDVALMLDLHRDATARGTGLFDIVSLVGSPRIVTIIGIVTGVVLLVRRRWILCTGWVVTLLGGGILDEVLKYTIRRPRPPYAAVHLSHMSFSFPSGHVVGSFVGYGMLAYLVLLRVTRQGVAALVAAATALLLLAIGFSRLYLGVHYFSDVAGGYAVGAFWLCITVTATDARYRGG